MSREELAQVLIALLLAKGENWAELKHMSTGEQINMLSFSPTLGHYLASLSGGFVLCGWSLLYGCFSFYKILGEAELQKWKQVGGWKGLGILGKSCPQTDHSWRHVSILYHNCGSGFMTVHTCCDSSKCTLKLTDFIICKVYPNKTKLEKSKLKQSQYK